MRQRGFVPIILVVVAVAVAAFLVVLTKPTNSNGPDAALLGAQKAVQSKNFQTFQNYVDIDAVVNNMVQKEIQRSSSGKCQGNECLVGLIAAQTGANLAPTQADLDRSKGIIEQLIEQGGNSDASLKLTGLTQTDSSASATLTNSSNQHLYLELGKENGSWKIISSDSDSVHPYEFLFMKLPNPPGVYPSK